MEEIKEQNEVVEKKKNRKELLIEIIKFVIIGGVNTLMGGILLSWLFQFVTNNYQITLFIEEITMDLSLILGFLVWMPFAYILQVKFVFKSEFTWKSGLLYPVTQIPNLIVNQLLLYLFMNVWHINMWNNLIARGLAAIATVPIMFVLLRLIIKPIKKRIKNEPNQNQ